MDSVLFLKNMDTHAKSNLKEEGFNDKIKLSIPLDIAISKMSYMIAKFMEDNGVEQMANKRRIQKGKDADITIFDPETVTDNSTMKDGGLPSTGIPYVIVNGTVIVKESKVLNDVYPCKPIRCNTSKK